MNTPMFPVYKINTFSLTPSLSDLFSQLPAKCLGLKLNTSYIEPTICNPCWVSLSLYSLFSLLPLSEQSLKQKLQFLASFYIILPSKWSYILSIFDHFFPISSPIVLILSLISCPLSCWSNSSVVSLSSPHLILSLQSHQGYLLKSPSQHLDQGNRKHMKCLRQGWI
jgi:hypothetical protein